MCINMEVQPPSSSGKSLVLLHRDLSSSFGSSAVAARGRSSKDVLSHQEEEQEINGISKRQGAKRSAALHLGNKRLLTPLEVKRMDTAGPESPGRSFP